MSDEEILKRLEKSEKDITIICKHFISFKKQFNRATRLVHCMDARGNSLVDIRDNLNTIVEELKSRKG
jgi:hypothetical protein